MSFGARKTKEEAPGIVPLSDAINHGCSHRVRMVEFGNPVQAPGRGGGNRKAVAKPLTPRPLPCHFWADNWKRRKVLGKQQSRRAVGVERPLCVDSPLPETRQVLPACICWADHDDDALNSVSFSTVARAVHSPARGGSRLQAAALAARVQRWLPAFASCT